MENINFYNEILMDHYRHPRHRGDVENPHFSSQVLNPSCGDSLSFAGKIKSEKLIAIKFKGTGCVISQAAASLLSEQVINQSVEKIMHLTKDDILALIGIALGPTRLRCGLLALEALQQGLVAYAQSSKNFNRVAESNQCSC
jgi:nitrogen fixation NifU-like protein